MKNETAARLIAAILFEADPALRSGVWDALGQFVEGIREEEELHPDGLIAQADAVEAVLDAVNVGIADLVVLPITVICKGCGRSTTVADNGWTAILCGGCRAEVTL
jgi:hypothetical protein